MNCTLTVFWLFYLNPSSRQKKQTSSKLFCGCQARVRSPVKLTEKVFFHHYSLLLALPNSSHKGLPPGFGESNPTWGGQRSPKDSQRQKETWKYFNTYQTMCIVDLQDNVVMLDAQLSSPGCSLLQSQSWWTVWCLLFCLSSHPKRVVQDTSKIILIVLAQTGQLISGLSSSVSAHCSETWHLARSLFERIGGNSASHDLEPDSFWVINDVNEEDPRG